MIDLIDKQFNEMVLQAKNLAVVYFWATWCGPCKLVTPVLEEIENNMSDKLQIFKVNVDSNQVTMNKYTVTNVPTLIIFKEGKVLRTVVGAISKTQLMAILSESI